MKNKLLFIVIFFVCIFTYAHYSIYDTQTMSFTNINIKDREITLTNDNTENNTIPCISYLGSQATIDLSISNNGIILFGVTTGDVNASNTPLVTTYVPDDNFEAYLETHNANGDTVALGAADSMGNGVIDDNMVTTSHIENVTVLDVYNQNIADLTGIEDFVALIALSCSSNNLTTLDLSSNTALTELYCYHNDLSTLNLSANTALTTLYCYDNNLNTLDLNANTALTALYCYDNNLSTLNLDTNNQLEKLWIYDNPNLATVYIQNGANNLLTGTFTEGSNTYPRFRALNTPNLTCIFVDDAIDANNGVNDYDGWQVDTTAIFVETEAACDALQITYVPDNHFEAYLENHNANGDIVALGAADSMGNGIMNDDYVLTSRIENVTSLDVYNQSISDLTGIEDFVALTGLECGHNDLSTLDVSTNMALTTLYCGSNNLSSLDVSTNTALTTLYCGNNNLSYLDVSANTALTALHCGANNLSTLDLSANTALTNLDCDTNNLSSLDLSTNTALTALYCYENNLSTLDLNANIALTYLYCGLNDLSTLNLDTNNQLERLWINDNPNLTTLHIQNGANNLLAGTYTIGGTAYPRFRADNNPSLTCIFVDNATDANNGVNDYEGWQVDATATFVETEAACDALQTTYVPDDNFEAYLETHNANGDTVALGAADSMGNGVIDDNVVPTSRIENVTSLDVNGNGLAEADKISDLTGIEDFVALTTLRCYSNNLSTLDLSTNTALTSLYCYYNDLTSLDISSNTALTGLNCFSNNLTTLDLSANTALTTLYCFSNNLNILDISSNTALTILSCFSNNLSTLDVSTNTALTELYCYHNDLNTLNLGPNTALTELSCIQNNLTTLDVSTNTALTLLSCDFNALTTLDVSTNTALTVLSCYSNDLNSLDLSENTTLTELLCGSNNLSTLDLTANTALTELFCNSNNLSTLNLDTNNQLEELWTYDNPNLTTLHIQNGANNLLAGYTSGPNVYARFRADNNPNLTCVFVDNATDANNGVNDYEGWQVDATATFVETEAACNALNSTYVPDDHFEAYLETHNANGDTVALGAADSMGNGVMNDDYVLTSRIENVTNLVVTGYGLAEADRISDLTGIEDFVALTNLDCSFNNLTTLNLTTNTALASLYCYYNELSTLDLSANTALASLYCYNNDLSTLDLSVNTALIHLNCSSNNLTSLDVSSNTALTTLYCFSNNLTTLELSSNTALTGLYCYNNALTTLDLSVNTALNSLFCYSNNLSALDLSANTVLSNLSCANNSLTTLDLSLNTALTNLNCNSDNLSTLDVRNIPVNQIQTNHFSATDNPNLTCIFTDDVAAAETNWTNIDATATFVQDEAACDALGYEDLVSLGFELYPNPVKDVLYLRANKTINQIRIYNMLGQEVINHVPLVNNFTLDVSNLKAGAYFIKVQVANQTGIFKFIKQ